MIALGGAAPIFATVTSPHSVRLALVLITLGLFIPLGFLPFAKSWHSRASWIENIQSMRVCLKGDDYAHVFTETSFSPPQPSGRKPDKFDEVAKEGRGRPASAPIIKEFDDVGEAPPKGSSQQFDAIPDPSPTGAVRKATKLPRYEELTAVEFLDAPARSLARAADPRLEYDVEKIVNGQIEIRDEYSRFVLRTDGTISLQFAPVSKDGFDFIPDEMGTFALFHPGTPAETRKVAVQSAPLPEAPSGERRIWQYDGFKQVNSGIFIPFSAIMLSGTILAFSGMIILIFGIGRREPLEKT